MPGLFHTLRVKLGNMMQRSATEGGADRSAVRRGASPLFLGGGGVPSVAMAVSTVYCCVSVISQTIASLPLRVVRTAHGLSSPDEGHPLNGLLSLEPNYTVSAFDFVDKCVQNILLLGNAYIYPRIVGCRVAELVLLSPGAVSYDAYADTYTVADVLQGVSGCFNDREIIHLKCLSLDGKTGVSVLSFARESVDNAGYARSEQGKRYRSGGIMRGLLTYEGTQPKWGGTRSEELEDVASYINEHLRGEDPMIAQHGDTKLTQLSMSSVDMQFLENRRFDVLEICRFFRVHPSYVYQDTSNNYKSAESASAAFLTNTLNPILRKIEQEMTRKLAPFLGRGRSIQFDRPALFSLDLDSHYRHLQARLALGTTVNEIRHDMGLPPVVGGDDALVSANLRSVDQTSQTSTQQV